MVKLEDNSRSYGQILRSSSMMGGANGINYLVGMVRMKLVAILLGPSGIGLVGLYVSVTGLVSTISQLGIGQSGVREVAEAESTGDRQRVAHVVKTLRRASWFTGLLGWFLTVAFAWPLSQWAFESNDRISAIAILGSTVFLSALSGGQNALLQGMRRVSEIAKVQVLSAILTTFLAIGIYFWLREEGIVPVIIATTATTLGFTWFFSSKIQIDQVSQSWTETIANSKRLVTLGGAFMIGVLFGSLVGVAIRALIVRKLGLVAGGQYQAAWILSGMFGGFILSAMVTDFYPRLSAVAKDDSKTNTLVNEQIEIGVLLAVPGLLGTLAIGPILIHSFYSSEFTTAAQLLPWFLLGVLGQVISWPLGLIQMAKGAHGWIYFSRAIVNIIWLSLAYILIEYNGLVGVCWSFAAFTWSESIIFYLIARRLSTFRLSNSVIRLVGGFTILVVVAFIAKISFGNLGTYFVFFATLVAVVLSARGITLRLGEHNQLSKILLKLPGMKFLCGSIIPVAR